MAEKKQLALKLDWFTRLLKTKPSPRRSILLTLISVGVLALIYLIYSVLFLGQIYPNVTVGGVEFGGLTKQEATAKLAELINSKKPEPITLIFEGNNYAISAAEVSWRADSAKTAETLYAVGRSPDKLQSFWEQVKAPFSHQTRELSASYDAKLLEAAISSVAEGVDQPAKDASARFVDGKLSIEKEAVGNRINQDEVSKEILHQWGSLSSRQINLQANYEAPKVVIADEAVLRSEAEKLASVKLKLTWEGGSKDLTSAEVAELVGFVGQTPEAPITDEGTTQQILVAQYTKTAAKAFVDKLAAEINQPASDPKLIIKDGKLAIAEASKQGRVVDVETSSSAVLAAMEATTEPRQATITFKIQEPIFTESNLDALGIKEIIGRGETSFAGSPANRRHNIKTGVSFLQSALIKPNEEFSTVKKLGAVDNTTGYLPELVIKENKTTPEYGGGLCQVSTTLFRSVLNAGLKVTERQNHSYRVSYYEPPVGLDATIYLPRPDFKFLNDTPGHILIQGQVVGNKVVFELWGTKDGRVSSVSDPIVTNIIPPPPEVRTDTDTLPKGEVKQIEKAHDGATAIAYYTVTRDGKVINKQTFKSVYKPWAARFLVGTKEETPPPAEPPPPQP